MSGQELVVVLIFAFVFPVTACIPIGYGYSIYRYSTFAGHQFVGGVLFVFGVSILTLVLMPPIFR